MAINKSPICPHMIRRMPEKFSWADHRLVRDRYIDYINHKAAILYLFLITVSDDLIRQQLLAYRSVLSHQALPGQWPKGRANRHGTGP